MSPPPASQSYSIQRNRNLAPDPQQVLEIPGSDGFAIIVQLQDFPAHRLWRGSQLAYNGGHRQGSSSIANLGAELRCQHMAAYDNVRLGLPRSSLDELFREEGIRGHANLNSAQDILDPVIYHLAQALLPTLERPAEGNRLFIDQVMLALALHIGPRYGNASQPTRGHTGLTPWQLRRAKELLVHHLTDGLSLEQLARECSLSRSHFSRAFRQSTGVNPQDWRLQMRVDKAKELLLHSDLELARISQDCGFADQSHMSRVFQRVTGSPPARWRRASRFARDCPTDQ
ncbi:helix-turn-helix domain-containing protein [Pseudomonas sp. YH-1]|uniref:helix-turn-helix domain-containing protein n=1 Tax=Pseudomonas sp. YH-1 TaxID=3384787 RepID=UPI003F7D0051